MTQGLAVLSGFVIAVMVMANGELSAVYGSYHATVLIHILGLILVCAILLAKKELGWQKVSLPWYLFTGGFIGVFTTISNIVAFSALGVSLTLGLGLLGQCALSLLIDGFGWMGAQKQSLSAQKILGLGVIVAGAAVMLFV